MHSIHIRLELKLNLSQEWIVSYKFKTMVLRPFLYPKDKNRRNPYILSLLYTCLLLSFNLSRLNNMNNEVLLEISTIYCEHILMYLLKRLKFDFDIVILLKVKNILLCFVPNVRHQYTSLERWPFKRVILCVVNAKKMKFSQKDIISKEWTLILHQFKYHPEVYYYTLSQAKIVIWLVPKNFFVGEGLVREDDKNIIHVVFYI